METFTLIDRFNLWLKESITIKLLSIGILVLILLIPTAWIMSIMEERQQRAEEVVGEVAGKWSGSQVIAGPVLVIPYQKAEKVGTGKDAEVRTVVENAYFLPATLTVKGEVNPQVLHRGIFDVAVYESTLDIAATFGQLDFASLGVAPESILWDQAKLRTGISDLRGIVETPSLTLGEKSISVEPTSNLGYSFYGGSRNRGDQESNWLSSGVEGSLPMASAADVPQSLSMKLALKGSSVISFLPVGRTTDVFLKGQWPDPSFDGEFLPNSRLVSAKEFEATWKVLHFNRPFAQQWVGDGKNFEKYDVSTRLIIPADQYQKSIRTVKYAILLILLGFTALFLVEISRKIRIHPFQYILIGAALIVYYTLLISLSEHVGYDIAYVMATAATVTLVTLYARSFLNDGKMLALFSGLLIFFYLFIFVIIQAQDYSLLLGSTGLFLVIAAIMYFSRSISWYGEK